MEETVNKNDVLMRKDTIQKVKMWIIKKRLGWLMCILVWLLFLFCNCVTFYYFFLQFFVISSSLAVSQQLSTFQRCPIEVSKAAFTPNWSFIDSNNSVNTLESIYYTYDSTLNFYSISSKAPWKNSFTALLQVFLPRNIIGIQLTPSGYVLFVLYELFVFLSLASHMSLIFADPGYVFHRNPPSNIKNANFCLRCNGIWKPPRAHHCSICNKCVFRMDHHCAWVNNCIGILNQKIFILFLFYTFISCSINILIVVYGGICFYMQKIKTITVSGLALIPILCLICIFFFCVSWNFLSEQAESVSTNSTLIETYMNLRGEEKCFMEHIKEVFGTNCFFWFFPVPASICPDFEGQWYIHAFIYIYICIYIIYYIYTYVYTCIYFYVYMLEQTLLNTHSLCVSFALSGLSIYMQSLFIWIIMINIWNLRIFV